MFTTEIKTRVALKNVMIATDFSPVSEAAFQYAEAIGRRFGSKLHAVHVVPPDAYKYVPGGAGEVPWDIDEQQAKKEMKHLDDRMNGIPHDTTIVRGEIADTIHTLISARNADLLVLGTHGRRGLGRVLLGSVAERVFRQAPCPVLTVGPRVTSDAPREIEFNRVLFATDFSDASLAAAPYAFSLAQEFQARLTLMHAVKLPLEPMESPQIITSEREKQLRNLVPPETDLWCRPEFVVTFGDAAQNILKVAKEQEADLIIFGVRGAGASVGVATHVSDAIAHEVVCHAKCPVLTVRG
ncbi:MAG TPA: universal stress protein [Candidatus Acidoferrum sp.]|nr:universal stress protein [Candidatus Acidoferrum sp.]